MSDEESRKTIYLKAWVSRNAERPPSFADQVPQDMEELEEETNRSESQVEYKNTSKTAQLANNPSSSPSKSQNILDSSINFILDHWKLLLAITIAIIIFLLTFLLVLFLAILKPSTQTNSTVIPESTTTFSEYNTTALSTIVSSTASSSSITTTTTIKRSTPDPTPAPRVICTNDFVMVNGQCLKLITSWAARRNATANCRKFGGASLVTIRNATQNQNVQLLLEGKGLSKVWIGLKCYGSFKSSCEWDYGLGNASTYNNFANGFPNFDFGTCIYFFTSESRWVSESCDDLVLPYICELPPTKPDNCVNNYDGYCYTRIDEQMTSFDSAEASCQNISSHIISIHSELENNYVMSLFTTSGYLLLGGIAPDRNLVLWNDRTARDYNNMKTYDGNPAPILMNCLTGEWYTRDWSSLPRAVCKRKIEIL